MISYGALSFIRNDVTTSLSEKITQSRNIIYLRTTLVKNGTAIIATEPHSLKMTRRFEELMI